MFDNILNFFKKFNKKENNKESSDTAKERLHLVLMQDRANVSADFLEMMRQEIIEVIKKYIEVDEKAIDVHLTNKANDDGTVGAPALYANIPIVTIKNEARKNNVPDEQVKEVKKESKNEKIENNAEKLKKANEQEVSLEEKNNTDSNDVNNDIAKENNEQENNETSTNKETVNEVDTIEEEQNVIQEKEKQETTSS